MGQNNIDLSQLFQSCLQYPFNTKCFKISNMFVKNICFSEASIPSSTSNSPPKPIIISSAAVASRRVVGKSVLRTCLHEVLRMWCPCRRNPKTLATKWKGDADTNTWYSGIYFVYMRWMYLIIYDVYIRIQIHVKCIRFLNMSIHTFIFIHFLEPAPSWQKFEEFRKRDSQIKRTFDDLTLAGASEITLTPKTDLKTPPNKHE